MERLSVSEEQLCVRLLGSLEVLCNQRQVGPAGAKRRGLFALLALEPNRVVPVSELIDGVWGDAPPASAVNLVQTYVSDWRRAFVLDRRHRSRHDRIRTTDGGYLLRLEPGESDLQRFRDLGAAGDAAAASAEPGRALQLYKQALALWRGPVLPELAGEPWHPSAAERLEEDRLRLLERWATASLAVGVDPAAVNARLAESEQRYPLRERLVELRMWALVQQGRQADALGAHERLRRRLVDELGVDPGPAVTEMQQRVLRQDPALTPAPAQHHAAVLASAQVPGRHSTAVTAAPVRVGDAPGEPPRGSSEQWALTGRSAELEFLGGMLAKGARGVVVAGPAGVGKTRLCAELVERHRRAGLPVLHLAATTNAREIPLGCMTSVLPGAPEAARTDLVQRAVSAIIGRTSPSRRLLIHIDDVHLADSSSLTVLQQVAMASSAFVLATERSEEADPLVDLWKDGFIHRIDLGPLPEGAMLSLLGTALNGDVDQHVVARLLRLADGSPLYLRELLHGALAAGHLARQDGHWVLADDLAPSRRLVDIVEARLRTLPEGRRSALELISTAEPAPLDVIEDLVGLDEVVQLEGQGLVRVDETGPVTLVLPAHPVYGEVVRAGLPRLRRRQAAARLAHALAASAHAERYVLQRALLALDGAVDLQPDLLETAALRAQLSGDHRLAARLARAALGAGAGTRAALVAAEAARALDQPALVDDMYREASTRALDDEDSARVVLSLARARLYAGDGQGAVDLAERGQRRVQTALARSALTLASAEFKGFMGQWAAARDLAATLTHRGAPADLRFGARAVEAFSTSFAGPHCTFPDIAAQAEAALQESHVPPDPLYLQWLRMAAAQVAVFSGGVEQVIAQCVDGARRAATGDEHPDYLGTWSMIVPLGSTLCGSVTPLTQSYADGALTALRRRDVIDTYSLAVSVAALTAAMSADLDRAEGLLAHYNRDLRSTEQKTTALADRAQAWLLRFREGPAAATDQAVRTAAGVLEQVPFYAAPILHDAVRFGDAGEVLDTLDDVAERLQAPLATLMAAHAHAVHDGDVERLVAAGEAFSALRARQLAAEAFTEADRLSGGDRFSARIRALKDGELVPLAAEFGGTAVTASQRSARRQ